MLDNGNNPYFIAKDIAEILGYADTDQSIRKNCKKQKALPVYETGQVRKLIVIPISDVFRLVMRSKLESAEQFQDWVYEEVLPSIQKTGSYNAKNNNDAVIRALKMLPLAHRAAKILGLDKNETLLSANKFVFNETGINPLKQLGHESIISESQKEWRNVTEIGKLVGQSAQATNRTLEALGFQVKVLDTWVATEKSEGLSRLFDSGKKHGNGVSIQQLKWCDDIIPALTEEIAKQVIQGGAKVTRLNPKND
jgi:prophage antirepressor-like protein